jgi:excisionase family DNA binding protein
MGCNLVLHDKLYTVSEVAKLLRVSEKQVRNWINKGELPAFSMERGYRIYEADLLAFIEKRKQRPPHNRAKN